MTSFGEKVAMAVSREKWVDRVRTSLEGALGEYAKELIAREIGFDYSWLPEVKRLLAATDEWLSPQTKLKSAFDRRLAFEEAKLEASLHTRQITKAKNRFIDRYLSDATSKQVFEVESVALDSRAVMEAMLTEIPLQNLRHWK